MKMEERIVVLDNCIAELESLCQMIESHRQTLLTKLQQYQTELQGLGYAESMLSGRKNELNIQRIDLIYAMQQEVEQNLQTYKVNQQSHTTESLESVMQDTAPYQSLELLTADQEIKVSTIINDSVSDTEVIEFESTP